MQENLKLNINMDNTHNSENTSNYRSTTEVGEESISEKKINMNYQK